LRAVVLPIFFSTLFDGEGCYHAVGDNNNGISVNNYGCTTISKTRKKKFFELRIKKILNTTTSSSIVIHESTSVHCAPTRLKV
jgi:hypothetical protein